MAELLTQHLSLIRIPSTHDKVYKDECAFCFDSPESENGLYISMCTSPFFGVGKKYVEAFSVRAGCPVFLHLKRIKNEIVGDEAETEKKQPTRLAIGVEGGFDVGEKKYDIQELCSILVMPGWHEFPVSFPNLPTKVLECVQSILSADSAARKAELEAMEVTWDGEVRIVSKHSADLEQLKNEMRVPPSGWKCEKCDLRENLWLNLTDGSIMCGRRNYDGSGGNNHAVEHFQTTGYPLAVKLGTITPDGADVYSYAEDDMVIDPLLADHLAHFGIDIMSMKKTEKTMAELELDMNQRVWEWSVLQESGSQLQPLNGPGLTGIHNLGNSCYMNAVMQVVMTIPQFVSKYYDQAEQIFESCSIDPTTDFNVQMAKFARGLLSGDHSKSVENADTAALSTVGIRPQIFKTLIGSGHREFSTKQQQDAHEFLLHLLTVVDRHSRGSQSPTVALKFRVEDRIECMQSHRVKYNYRDDYELALPIPLEAAINKDELQAFEIAKVSAESEGKSSRDIEVLRATIPLSACLEVFASPTLVDDFYSSAVNARTTAKKITRFATFPEYLFLHMQKFTVGDDWVERKLDVSLDMPDVLDISHLRGTGKLADEEELADAGPAAAPAVVVDEAVVSQLVDMGFPRNACVKGVHFSNNTGIEPAMNWIMEHMSDPDFDLPLQSASTSGSSVQQFVPDEGSLSMIESMGFSRRQAVAALKATENNLERAVDWIFSHPDEIEREEMDQSSAPEPQYLDGSGKYRLVAFISHMGTSTKCGHYVCHILRGDEWVIFNDEKVALSEHPPKDLAYIYLYQRL